MIRIRELQAQPFHSVRFLNAGRNRGDFFGDLLPVQTATVDRLPDSLDAIIATADLQGRETFEQSQGRPLRLLGEVLPEMLVEDILPSIGLNAPRRIGVILAGDFYTVPALDKRGGSGDVTSVWTTFAQEFMWVAGVAGNHDVFGSVANVKPRSSEHMRFLDQDIVEMEGIRIGGLSGIMGNPKRLWRRLEPDFNLGVEALLESAPDILVMHDGPCGTSVGQPGHESTLRIIETCQPTLVIRGHAHWNDPLCELGNGTQILNVDQRVVILRR